jgi:hypothetical protein
MDFFWFALGDVVLGAEGDADGLEVWAGGELAFEAAPFQQEVAEGEIG